jgi:catechol 2,3-dioxygenase-like lactoylglutathione lyase family enzyme
MLHHISIRTADIHRSIAFYECLGFTISERFTTGYTLACWMEGLGGRIELIQIPEPKPAPDAFNDEHYVGYYHLSFDLTELSSDLTSWLTDFSTRLQSIELLAPTILLAPSQQIIGAQVYEVAFLADPDSLPLELIRRCSEPAAASL